MTTLQTYGRHLDTCDLTRRISRFEDQPGGGAVNVEPRCSCGFSAALLASTEGWQPIATADKDADVVLLYLDGSGVQPGYWEKGRWLACETSALTGGRWHAEPTHWMPLPKAPSPPSGSGSKTT